MHLDDDQPGTRSGSGRRPPRPTTPIGIMLKSTPPGATVFVDGQNVGVTPKYWAGIADGNEHDFAFTRPGYALARYRFVPVSNGTLHASLERVGDDTPSDGGLEPMIAPKFAPDAAVAPPPTVLSPPPDARMVAPPAVDASVPVTSTIDAPSPSPPTEPKPTEPKPPTGPQL
jgi:hypothetical protein